MTASSVKRFDIRYLIPVIARVFDKNTFAVKKLYVAVPVFNRYRYISEIRLDGKREQTEFVGKSVKGAYFRYTVVIGKARSDRFGTFFVKRVERAHNHLFLTLFIEEAYVSVGSGKRKEPSRFKRIDPLTAEKLGVNLTE